MKSTANRAACVFLAMAAAAASAETKWFSVDAAGGNRFWSEAAGWQPTPTLPTTADGVGMNSLLTPPGNPLVITNGTEAVCWTLRLADHDSANYAGDGRIPSLHMSGGLLSTWTNWWSDALAVGYHEKGYGLLTLSGGTLSNVCLTVGASGIGVVTNDGGTVKLSSAAYLGLNAKGRGTFVQKSGTFSGSVTVGYYGTGTWIQAGGTVVNNTGDFFVGRNSSAAGLLDVRAPGLTLSSGLTLYIGYSGLGVLEQRANLVSDYFKIGGNTGRTSIATVYEGATNLVTASCNIGGYYIPVEAGVAEMPGNGTLRLKGGVLRFPSDSSSVNLFVGRLADGHGRIEGWGTVAPLTAGGTNIRMLLGRGVIQADGEGESRTLDLNQVVSVTNSIPNGADGTNGWYAVNKGRVLYPRTWFDTGGGTVSRCIGDWSRETTPGLVNSIGATFTGVTHNNNFFRGNVCAIDRDDIPGGLPADGMAVGVWQLGVYKDLYAWTASQAAPFATVALTFRYDHNRVKSHQKLSLYRHSGSAWVKVGGGSVTADHCIATAAPLPALTGADTNIGWFALLARNGGTLISIH